MHIAFRNLRRCVIGLFSAVSLSAAELPAPLSSALNRLRTVDAYAWTMDLQTHGAPFSFAPIRGWANTSGECLMEMTVERKTIRAASLGGRRVVKQNSAWNAPSEVAQENGLLGAEVARLLGTPLPVDDLSRLLEDATAIRAESDGTFSVTLSAEVATEIIRAPMKYLPKRGPVPEMKGAVASIQLWIKNGALKRYVISGTANLSLPFGIKEIKQTTVVELRETSVAEATLPPTALSKLQAIAQPYLTSP